MCWRSCRWSTTPTSSSGGFSAADSPAAIAGSLVGHCEERHGAETGPNDADGEVGDDAGKAPHGKGYVWPASFLLSNIRGLVGLRGRNKSPFLHDLATQRNCLWMAVTETWLSPRVLDSEILVHVPGFTIIRQDRIGRIRGGVCLFLREDLTGEIVTSYSNGVCEFLVVHVHQVNTIVVVVYRPPDTKYHEFSPVLSKLSETLKDLPSPSPTITIMGDFNFPSSIITWRELDGLLLPQVANHRACAGGDEQAGLVRKQAAALCDLVSHLHLTQQVRQPTREDEILDLIWSSDPDLVSNIQIDPFPSFTDHYVVTASTSYKVEQEVVKERKYLLPTKWEKIS